jgi:hypothetical protein
MKRGISAVLSFLVLMVALYVSPVSPVGAVGEPTGTNLILNGDFAAGTGYTTSTKLPAVTNSFVTGLNYRTWFRAQDLSNAIADDGDAHGKFLRTKQYAFQGVPLEQNKTYTLKFDSRGIMGGTTDKMRVYICKYDVRGTPLGITGVSVNDVSSVTTGYIAVDKSTEWTSYLITFKVTAALTAGVTYCLAFQDVDYNSTDAQTLDIDNVELYENEDMFSGSAVADGSFEYTQNLSTSYTSETDTLRVLKQQAATTTPVNIWHQAEGAKSQLSRITAEDAHSGVKSAIVNPYLYMGVPTEAGKTYLLRFWAKARNFDAITFRLVSTDNRAMAINTEGSRTAELTETWAEYTYTITMPGTVSGSTLLSFYTNNTTSGEYNNYNANDVYLDDVTLAPVYTITVSTPDNRGTITGDTSVPEGGNTTLTITPNLYYEIDDVLVDDISVGPVTTYTFINVTKDHTISAVFKLDCSLIFPAVENYLLKKELDVDESDIIAFLEGIYGEGSVDIVTLLTLKSMNP